jgi:asparaginyl-tRNA synthetase
MRIKAKVANIIRTFFINHGFTEIWTPLILVTATEGGADLFPIVYFGKEAFLAQSAQFYKQAAISTHECVFGILPSWRSEKSRTTKHLNEFWQIECEIAWATLENIMEIIEELLITVCREINKVCKEELEILGRNLPIPDSKFKRYTFDEAKQLVEKLGVKDDPESDFSATAEQALAKYHTQPFFIHSYPSNLRGLYYKTSEENKDMSLTVDLFVPEHGELVTGGERVSDYKELVKRLTERGMELYTYQWYLEIFKYGMPPHAGFGMGFERLVRWICNLPHVRDACLFPRTPDIVTP